MRVLGLSDTEEKMLGKKSKANVVHYISNQQGYDIMSNPKYHTSMNLTLARMVLDRVEAPGRARRKARNERDAQAEVKRLHKHPSKRGTDARRPA